MIIINYFVTKKKTERTDSDFRFFLKILHKHIIMLLEDMSYTLCMYAFMLKNSRRSYNNEHTTLSY